MGQAHSAGLGTVIEIGRHDEFRFSATKFGGALPDRWRPLTAANA
jgi:hypothetical protein